MKYLIHMTSQFKKDLKLAHKRKYPLEQIHSIITQLANGETLAQKHKDHALTGTYAHYRKCHITPDWLLIYTIQEQELILVLSRTGTHSDLF